MERIDRRVARTRGALIAAFNQLVLQRRQRRIRVTDIAEQANVGRSTFYEHFGGADEILLEALSRPLATLADAAAGAGDPARLSLLLAHFWDNRQRGRETLDGRLRARVARLLAEMIESRLAARDVRTIIPVRLATLQLAETALAPIRGWIAGEAPCAAEALATAICRTGERSVAALTAGPEAGAKGPFVTTNGASKA